MRTFRQRCAVAGFTSTNPQFCAQIFGRFALRNNSFTLLLAALMFYHLKMADEECSSFLVTWSMHSHSFRWWKQKFGSPALRKDTSAKLHQHWQRSRFSSTFKLHQPSTINELFTTIQFFLQRSEDKDTSANLHQHRQPTLNYNQHNDPNFFWPPGVFSRSINSHRNTESSNNVSFQWRF